MEMEARRIQAVLRGRKGRADVASMTCGPLTMREFSKLDMGDTVECRDDGATLEEGDFWIATVAGNRGDRSTARITLVIDREQPLPERPALQSLT